MHRLEKRKDGGKARNVIIRFSDKHTKDAVHLQRKKLIKCGNPVNSIFLNDSLTHHRQHLLYAARRLVKERKLFTAWSKHGNILVKKNEGTNVIQVQDHSDLMNIKLSDITSKQEEPELRGGLSSRDTSNVSHITDYEFFYESD